MAKDPEDVNQAENPDAPDDEPVNEADTEPEAGEPGNPAGGTVNVDSPDASSNMSMGTVHIKAPPKPKPDEAVTDVEKKRLARFAKLAHVEPSDIIKFDHGRLVGVTKFGGKYQMNSKGTQLRHLAGPVPEGVQTEQQAALQERLEREINAAS